MNKKKSILFVCNEIGYNLKNRKSAIDSILDSLLTTMKSEYEIFVNGTPYDELHHKEKSSQSSSKIKTLIAKLIPKGIKEKIKINKLLKHNRYLIDSIQQSTKDFDFVFELYKLASSAGYELAEHFNAKYILYYDSPVVEQYEELWGIVAPYKKTLMESQIRSVATADHIICYSKPVEEFLRKMGARKEISIFQTLDYSRLNQLERIQHESLNIGFIGSFMPWHRVDLLINAFNNLSRNEKQSMKLYLIGKGECYEQMKTLAGQSEFSDHIIFTGFVDGDQLDSYKAILDIGVMPGSNWYGMPTKIYEYGACGIASLAPNTPTISDLFKDEHEIVLFDWDDENSFQMKLSEIVNSSEKRKTLGSNMQELVCSKNTVENAKQFYLSLFK